MSQLLLPMICETTCQQLTDEELTTLVDAVNYCSPNVMYEEAMDEPLSSGWSQEDCFDPY